MPAGSVYVVIGKKYNTKRYRGIAVLEVNLLDGEEPRLKSIFWFSDDIYGENSHEVTG